MRCPVRDRPASSHLALGRRFDENAYPLCANATKGCRCFRAGCQSLRKDAEGADFLPKVPRSAKIRLRRHHTALRGGKSRFVAEDSAPASCASSHPPRVIGTSSAAIDHGSCLPTRHAQHQIEQSDGGVVGIGIKPRSTWSDPDWPHARGTLLGVGPCARQAGSADIADSTRA